MAVLVSIILALVLAAVIILLLLLLRYRTKRKKLKVFIYLSIASTEFSDECKEVGMYSLLPLTFYGHFHDCVFACSYINRDSYIAIYILVAIYREDELCN